MLLPIILQMPISLALATFLNFVGKKGDICKVIWFIPLLMYSVAIGYLFRYALAPSTGFVTAIPKLFGGGPSGVSERMATYMSVPVHVTLLPIFPLLSIKPELATSL